MITEDQLREALKRCTDEDTKPLADEVPPPDLPGAHDRHWAAQRAALIDWVEGVDRRRLGVAWSDVEVGVADRKTQGVRDGWLAQHLEYLRWQHRDDNICPACFEEPAAELIRSGVRVWRCRYGHHWHWCPLHEVKVAGELHLNCTCGATDKEIGWEP